MPVTIHSLHIYPVKSCQGISLESVELVDTGFKYDRHWMVIDKQGQFLSQRQLPNMALIKARLTPQTLTLSTTQNNQLIIPLTDKAASFTSVKIWNASCRAAIVSNDASQWFSNFLETPCDLVFLPQTEKRHVDSHYANTGQTVGFADGFPLLVVSRASIDLLNSHLPQKVNIDRFRANIIIDGCEAHAEDEWSQISVNDIEIQLVKACSRCVIPSINQQTAKKHLTLLKTLASYRRRRDGRIYLGQNGLHRSSGTISRGQLVTILKK